MTLELSGFEGNGQRPGFGTATVPTMAEDACYDRGSTTRLRRFLTDAVAGPEIVEIDILCGIRLFLYLYFGVGLLIR